MAGADPGVIVFMRAVAAATADEEPLVVHQWELADWEALFSLAQRINVARGEMLIRQSAAERALYLIASGVLKVISVASYIRVSAIGWFHPGSVVGELSFLDGKARSAQIVAVADSELYRLGFEDYLAFADTHPRKACDLALAIGSVVAVRLRNTLSTVERSIG
jgi:CRP-like cAMP-binding protein